MAVLYRLLPLVWPSRLALRLAAVVRADGAWGRGGSVRPEQPAGEADEWLYLGDGHHGLDISPETAQRLRWAIGWLMDSEVERN